MPLTKARQLTLNLHEGERRKKQALDYAEARLTSEGWLQEARRYARHHCYRYGTVTADDIEENVEWPEHLNKALKGSLFRCKDFEKTGTFVLSKQPQNHRRLLWVWRLKEDR